MGGDCRKGSLRCGRSRALAMAMIHRRDAGSAASSKMEYRALPRDAPEDGRRRSSSSNTATATGPGDVAKARSAAAGSDVVGRES